MSSQVRLTLLPSARCLFDEPVQLKVSGLRAQQRVTVRAAATDDRGVRFSSWAWYKADDGGEVDLHRDPSLGGSYVGLQPMGLLWSMRPDTLHKHFYKTQALVPHTVVFSVHDGQEEEGQGEGQGGMLAEATNERLLMAEGVTRLPVQQDGFQGVLFTPPGKGPFPAVLDLCTFMSEKRGGLLASRGFVVLTLPVFSGKVDNLEELHLDPFEEAAKFLRRQPKVGGQGVGVIARSKGGDIALALASFVPGIEAVVWINGCSSNVGLPLHYKKRRILSPIRFDPSKMILTESGARMIKQATTDPLAEENKDSLVPIQQAQGRILFVAAEDDLNWDSKGFMEAMVDTLKHHGKDNFQSVCYAAAGHLLEPPFGPFCPSAFHGLLRFPVLWGGEPKAHVEAEVHCWKMVQEFFKTHLSLEAPHLTASL